MVSHYRDVKIDFFKENGAYATSATINWLREMGNTPAENFRLSLQEAKLQIGLRQLYAVAAVNPEGHPLMLMPYDRLAGAPEQVEAADRPRLPFDPFYRAPVFHPVAFALIWPRITC
jgi:hypothetical protein